jgi:uncharacterized protein (DUF924 family)
MKQTANDVIDFWVEAGPSRWFRGGEAFDAQCRAALLDPHMVASRAELAHWVETAEGALALVLLLDQIPRNVFRGSAHAYATDPMALAMAKDAIARGHDRRFETELRSFFYLPFMHSEALREQERCVELFKDLPESGSAPWAVHHHAIIERFGRFPHRNRLLGRQSTAQELVWMEEGGFQG